MATSQSLVARAVPRALDPNNTTASMPGIAPTASAAVRRRRAWVVVFIAIHPQVRSSILKRDKSKLRLGRCYDDAFREFG